MNCVGLVRQETKVLTGMGNGQMYIFDWNAFGYHSDAFGDHPTGINAVLSVTDTHAVTGCDDGKIRAIRFALSPSLSFIFYSFFIGNGEFSLVSLDYMHVC